MSHGLDTLDGRASAAYLETAAWHKLGEVVAEPLSGKEMMEVANVNDLDYHLEPLIVAMGGDLVDTGKLTTVGLHPLTRERRIVGGYHSPNFSLETPEVLEQFIGLLTEYEGVKVSSVGLVDKGARLFFSLLLTEMMLGGVDRTEQHLLVCTGFDGSLATTVKLLNFRVECANMLNAGLGSKSEFTFTARHTSALLPRVDEARTVLDLAWKSTEKFDKEVAAMLEREVTDAQFARMVQEFVPLGDEPTRRKETAVDKARGLIFQNYRFGNAASLYGTEWGALNAITEYVDHQSGRTRKDAMDRALESFLDDRTERERGRARQVVGKVLAAV